MPKVWHSSYERAGPSRSRCAAKRRTGFVPLIGAPECLIRLRKDLEGHVPGVLRTFGIRMTVVGQAQQQQGFRYQLAAAGKNDPVLRAIADRFIAAHSTLRKATADLDRASGFRSATWQHSYGMRWHRTGFWPGALRRGTRTQRLKRHPEKMGRNDVTRRT